jgi:hypothetical protein
MVFVKAVIAVTFALSLTVDPVSSVTPAHYELIENPVVV